MAKAREIVRIYTGADADMTEASRVMHRLFKEDLETFGNFDPVFGNRFESSWLTKIVQVEDTVDNNQPLGEQAGLTKIVQDKMEECRQHIQYLKYFVERAFPGNPEILTEFGFNDYNAARHSEIKMLPLLGIIHKNLIKHQTEITATGVSPEKIALTAVLKTQLNEANENQEIAKKKRPSVTQERIKILNECYEFMQKVSRAGKIIFANNYAKYNQYLLPNEKSSKAPEETLPPEKPKEEPVK